jgi:ribosomal protein L24
LLRKKSLVVVEGILPRIKYTKNRQGGDPVKQEIPVSIHVSNVMLWDSEKCGRKNWLQNGGRKKKYAISKSGNLVQK